jgi:hypothetical protein
VPVQEMSSDEVSRELGPVAAVSGAHGGGVLVRPEDRNLAVSRVTNQVVVAAGCTDQFA